MIKMQISLTSVKEFESSVDCIRDVVDLRNILSDLEMLTLEEEYNQPPEETVIDVNPDKVADMARICL